MKKVLVAVLDWGLGHATRSLPVIKELERQGCEVFLAGAGESLALLRKELPARRAFTLPAYAPRYPGKRGSMVISMALQLPRFICVIERERRALEEIIRHEKIDLIVSDNRYGCHSKKVRSILITHQSNILMPRRFGFLAAWVRRLNARLMNRFDECWIPDFPAGESLAGYLSTFGRSNFRIPVRYIGWLSRFEIEHHKGRETLDVLAILSGPEPQRSLLEDIVLPQLKATPLKFLLVRGLPTAVTGSDDTRVVNFLGAVELQAAIESAALIIARSGYSTVMDLKALGKRVIFIPTPGQTEQEYLGRNLMQAGIALCVSQNEFDLQTALLESKNFSGFVPGVNNALLVSVIQDVLHPQPRRTNELLA